MCKDLKKDIRARSMNDYQYIFRSKVEQNNGFSGKALLKKAHILKIIRQE